MTRQKSGGEKPRAPRRRRATGAGRGAAAGEGRARGTAGPTGPAAVSEPRGQRRYERLMAEAEAAEQRARREAVPPAVWPAYQVRQALCLMAAAAVESVVGVGYVAAGAGLVAVCVMTLRLRAEWTPPGDLGARAGLLWGAAALAAVLPLISARVGWVAGGLGTAVAAGLALYVTVAEGAQRRRGGFVSHLAQETAAVVTLSATATLVAGERLWPWVLWIGALYHVHVVGLTLLGARYRLEQAKLGRSVPATAGLLVALLFLPLPRVPVAALVCLGLGVYYGRSALHAAGGKDRPEPEPARPELSGLDEEDEDLAGNF